MLEKIFPFVGPQGNKRLSEEEAAVSHTQLTTVKPHVDVMLGAMHYFADHGSKLEAPSGKGAGEGAGPVQPALAPHPVHDPLSKVVGHTREALQAGVSGPLRWFEWLQTIFSLSTVPVPGCSGVQGVFRV